MLINVKPREIKGKQVKHLRAQFMIPASIYGAQRNPSVSVLMNETEAIKAFKENGFSNVFDVQVEGEAKPIQAVFKEIQHHPVKGNIIHMSIHQIEMNKEISAEIPIDFLGVSLAVKNNLGLLVTPLNSIEVSCLPKNLPHNIEIDLTHLENVGDSITVDSLKLPEGVAVGHNTPKDAVIAYISAPQKIEEETAAVTTATAEAASAEASAAAAEGDKAGAKDAGKGGK